MVKLPFDRMAVGMLVTPPAASTPGHRADVGEQVAVEGGGARRLLEASGSGNCVFSTTSRSGLKPMSTEASAARLRASNPAPATSTTAMAISATTKALRTQTPRGADRRPLAAFAQSGAQAARARSAAPGPARR